MDHKPPRLAANEIDTVLALLDFQRESIIRKVEGLDDEQSRRRLVGSETSLLWLLRHLERAESTWVLERFAGGSPVVGSEALSATETSEFVVNAYRSISRRVNEVARTALMDDRCDDSQYTDLNLRWVLGHLLEETARHAGHADILRELIDGSTGR